MEAVTPVDGRSDATGRLRLRSLMILAAFGFLSLTGTQLNGQTRVHRFTLTERGKAALMSTPGRPVKARD